jgi:hypothetical protein
MKMSSPPGVALSNVPRPSTSVGPQGLSQTGNPQIGRLEQKFNQKGFIPPGIAKKIPPRPVPQNQQPPVGVASPLNPQGVLIQPAGQPVIGLNGLQQQQQRNLIQAGAQPVIQPVIQPPIRQALPQAIPQLSSGFGSGSFNLINPNPPGILSGVSEAFATGNPLAGPLQLVNNINANALNTVRAAGLF